MKNHHDNSKFLKALKGWHKIYRFSTFTIVPILSVLSLLFISPILYKDFIVNAKYCINDKEVYERYLREVIKKKPITDIYLKNYGIKFIGNDTVNDELFIIATCSEKSKNENAFFTKDIKVGDTIFKEFGSNEFKVIKEGKEYIFDIDSNRDIKGELIE